MSNELIRTMFKHLLKTYTLEESRALLTAKFPKAADIVNTLIPDDFKEEERVHEAKAERVKADKAVKETKPKRTRAKSGPDKKTRGMEIYKSNLGKSRKEMIEIYVNEFDFSTASASNLYHTCKKEYSA